MGGGGGGGGGAGACYAFRDGNCTRGDSCRFSHGGGGGGGSRGGDRYDDRRGGGGDRYDDRRGATFQPPFFFKIFFLIFFLLPHKTPFSQGHFLFELL
jgi:hypothetical protein